MVLAIQKTLKICETIALVEKAGGALRYILIGAQETGAIEGEKEGPRQQLWHTLGKPYRGSRSNFLDFLVFCNDTKKLIGIHF